MLHISEFCYVIVIKM